MINFLFRAYSTLYLTLLHLSCGSATNLQVIENHKKEFFDNMNSRAIAAELRVLGLIPESVESGILQSKSRRGANVLLFEFLMQDPDEQTVIFVFGVASKKTGYLKMNTFAAFMLRVLQ